MESKEPVDDEMYVTKRNGTKEKVSFDKILNRIKTIGQPKELNVNYTALVMKIIDQIFDGIQTEQIDEVLAQQCASMCSIHYDYYILASRLLVSNHQKQTRNYHMYDYVQLLTDKFGDKYISKEFRDIIESNTEKIEEMIVSERDYEIDYFGFKTLERAYLMRKDDVIIENIQYMWMRVAIQIHGNNMEKVKETYDCLSQKMFIHATPTLFNSGTKRPQLSSCFLLGMEEDSINGIFNTLKDCALISKWAGGIGLHIHNIRSNGSHIEGTNGKSHGIVPMLRVYNNTARYCDQGGKRHGSFAMYMEPWHADVEHYLELRKNHGDEEARARDLFYALWIPDYFMECVHKNDDWYLMCPNKSPNLFNVYGSEFTELYKSYVENGQYVKKVKAREIWFKILDSQMETGTPYMLYKDSANKKSNQKNLGVIKSSNLCVAPETLILTDDGHKEIKSLNEKEVRVWNGFEWSNVTIKQTGLDEKLVRVNLSDLSHIDCTKYHKFYIKSRNPNETNPVEVRAHELICGDIIIDCDYPIIDGNVEGDSNNIDVVINCMSSLSSKLKWLGNVYDRFGVHSFNVGFSKFVIQHDNLEYIRQMGQMLQTCGVSPLINFCETTNKFKLRINFSGCCKLSNNGFTSQMFSVLGDKVMREEKYEKKIVSVCDEGRHDETYCFTEPLRHMGIFNGTITGQCTEIIEFSNEEESAVCNLASISLPAFINKKENKYDFERLSQISEIVTENLNNIIDSNFYPTDKTKRSNFRHRPIGIGVQGLADVFAQMKIPFESDKAKQLNSKIFEAIYYGSMKRSNDISIQRQKDISDIQHYLIDQMKKNNSTFWIWFIQAMKDDIYEQSHMKYLNEFTESMTMDSSIFHDLSSDMFIEKYTTIKPTMREIFGTDFCKSMVDAIEVIEKESVYKNINIPNLITTCNMNISTIRNPQHCGAYSSFEGSPLSKGELQFDLWGESKEEDKWTKLKSNIQQYGTRNSLCIAPMPTASTSQILGNNECFEPFTSNIYMRRTIAGEFTLVNKYLFRELYDLGLWNNAMKNEIIRNKGSVQNIELIPENIRERFKVSWEIKPETIMDMARDRSIYICQSQSMNLWVEDPNYKNLTKIHFYGWKKGLKTGMYYLRRKAKHQAQQFTVEPVNTPSSEQLENKVNPITQQTEDDVCELCSA